MPHKRKRGELAGGVKAGLEGQEILDGQTMPQRTDRKGSGRKAREEGVSRSMARVLVAAKGIRPPSGLDEGNEHAKPSRKAKVSQQKLTDDKGANEPAQTSVPQILPGERLADYSARVDAALPLQGRTKRNKSLAIPGLKQPQTRNERKMQRMQQEWRLEDAKLRAKREEAAEDLEDEMDEQLPGVSMRHFSSGKNNAFDDPWAVVAANRATKQSNKGLVGVHDVVQAPPRLKQPRSMVREGGQP